MLKFEERVQMYKLIQRRMTGKDWDAWWKAYHDLMGDTR